jgi:hypothetical protein
MNQVFDAQQSKTFSYLMVQKVNISPYYGSKSGLVNPSGQGHLCGNPLLLP